MKLTGKRMLVVVDAKYFNTGRLREEWMQTLKTKFNFKKIDFVFTETETIQTEQEKSDGPISLSVKDFNWIGRLKNPELRTLFLSEFDFVFTIGKHPLKVSKLLNKVKSNVKIGVNVSPEMNCSIKLNTELEKIIQITNFASDTMDKIVFA